MDFFFPVCNLKKAEDSWTSNEAHDILNLHAVMRWYSGQSRESCIKQKSFTCYQHASRTSIWARSLSLPVWSRFLTVIKYAKYEMGFWCADMLIQHFLIAALIKKTSRLQEAYGFRKGIWSGHGFVQWFNLQKLTFQRQSWSQQSWCVAECWMLLPC